MDTAPHRSHRDALIARRGREVHRLKARDSTGRWAYYLVLVLAARERAFLEALRCRGDLDLKEFGEVIASCYGEAPSEAMRAEVQRRFGFEV